MSVSQRSGFASTRSTHNEALLYKERLVNFFESALVLPHCRGYGICSHRTAFKLDYYGFKYLVVYSVEAQGVYVQGVEGISCDI